MRRSVIPISLTVLAAVAVTPTIARAQHLRDKISQLFVFGDGQEPLFLAGSATASNPASVKAHGNHYIPAAVGEKGSIIGFLVGSLGASVGNVPIGATASGETFRFEGGVPISTATSAGPIFGERGQTLGRGRMLVGMNRSSFQFSTLRGIPMSNIGLTFTHENVDYPGCAADNGGLDCKKLGVPLLENETMAFNLNLDINVQVSSFYATFGLTDRIDIGVVVPLTQASVTGRSDAQINPFGPPPAAHFFAGSSDNPVLTAARNITGSAFGVGDVAARLKVNAYRSPKTFIAFMADARFPTGDAQDLLGSGSFALRTLAIASSRFGDFSPHVNAGYLYHAGPTQNDAVLATVGFDHLLGPSVTLGADIVSEFQVGTSKLRLPQSVTFDYPYRRSVNTTSIPDMRDNILNGSLGFKFAASKNTLVVTNAIIPLNRGGLRANQTYTLGIEYGF